MSHIFVSNLRDGSLATGMEGLGQRRTKRGTNRRYDRRHDWTVVSSVRRGKPGNFNETYRVREWRSQKMSVK